VYTAREPAGKMRSRDASGAALADRILVLAAEPLEIGGVVLGFGQWSGGLYL
jgi:hypothetical protein